MASNHKLDLLYRQCTSALDGYMNEAHTTCSMLGRRIEGEPVTLQGLIDQHKRESMAQAKYERTRQRLVEVLRNLANQRCEN
jgi:hypothetical protein